MARPSVLIIPRPELSAPEVEVDEFRIRAHDGIRLFGLRARPRLVAPNGTVRVRLVGPCELPQIDQSTVQDGTTEFVLQLPAGRRLEDRVLDVLRVCQLASERESAVQLFAPAHDQEPDEFLIAAQLLSNELDGSDGFPTQP